MPRAAAATPDNIDVVGLIAGLLRRWRSLSLLTLTAGALAFTVLSLMRPVFSSEAQIAIVARGETNPFADPKAAAAGEAVTVRVDREAINTHARALQATELAQRIASDLQLVTRPEFNAAAGPDGPLSALVRVIGIGKPNPAESDEDRVLAAFAKRLAVTPTKDSRTIAIRFSAQDRELAAEVANRVGLAYRERLAARTVIESNDVQSGLSPRIDRLKQEVADAESEVERFRGTANIFKGGSHSSLNEQQLGELTASESRAKTELGEAEARARAARELMAKGSAEVHPSVQKSPILQKLIQDRARIEGDVAKATATMKEGHPALKQLRSELAATERQISLEVRRVIDGLDKEVSVASLRLASVQKAIAETKSRVVNTGGDQARLSQLEANARAKKSELERLQAQFEANRARADTRIVPIEVQVVSQARPASEASFPKKMPYTGLVMAATLLLSMSLMIAKDLITGARTPPPVRAAAASLEREPPSLTNEAVEPRSRASELPAATAKDGEQVGSIGELSQRLLALQGDQRGRRTLLAGASASVDPSAEAVELARALARQGSNILLIDWSLDGSGVARLLGLPASAGISELLDDRAGFADVIGRVPGSTAHLIASGVGLVSASGRGDVDRLNLVLDTLDEIYEQIVVAARFNAARDLFETIEGRFDAGVLIGELAPRARPSEAVGATFLGFEVESLRIIRLARNLAATGARKGAKQAAA